MRCYYSPSQELHAPPTWLLRGKMADSPEGPLRSDILKSVLQRENIDLTEPTFSNEEAERQQLLVRLSETHTQRYLHFLQTIHTRWIALPGASDTVIPNVHPVSLGAQYPQHPVGQAGWHLGDMATPITATSFEGILASAATAQAAAEDVKSGAKSAYALCRPPGHHAGPESAGGFCFLNNSALAATILREKFAKVAILDVDLHHGNGTQDIFYHRADVWTGSLHADTQSFYPFFWGGEQERGAGEGEGFNVNLPLPIGTEGPGFLSTLDNLVEQMQLFKPEAMVIALGLDAHKDDPLAGLALETSDFYKIGQRLAALQLPTVIVQEGGYATEHLGNNLVAFLQGFSQH